MTKQDKLQELFNKSSYRSSAERVDERHSSDEKKKFNWFLKNTSLDVSTASFFEIAPGSGTLFNFLKKNGAKNYLACDSNENVYAQFSKYFPNDREVLIKDEALSAIRGLANKEFDCFIAFMVLEHLESDYFVELFSLMTERLKPGGEIWINVPCAESIVSIFGRYYDLTHRRSFIVNNFEILSETYGLSIKVQAGKMVDIHDVKSLIRYVHNGMIYWINRFIFAFTIGVRKELGVFSDELSIILKK